MKKNTLVSVDMITYNHEPYIKQAIEGVLMQETNFEYELIIADDCSPDNTPIIINDIIKNHPKGHRIKYFRHKENLGMQANGLFALQQCTGKYIALCEGDDYWTDLLKLQKQVDFLETNTKFSLCSHRYKIYDEVLKTWDVDYGAKLFETYPKGIIIDNKLNFEVWLTKTMTLMFRKDAIDFTILNRYKYTRDEHLCYHLLKGKNGFCFNFDGAVYRRHEGGVFSKTTDLYKARVAYKICTELYSFEKDDTDVMQRLNAGTTRFFDAIRIQIENKNYSKALLNDLFLIVKNEYKRKGLVSILYYLRKILLSVFKSQKAK
jgi:glycosyltransferase involved in cell wall biosynthesis